MQYSQAYLRVFLPPEDPPEGSVPGEVLDEALAQLEARVSSERDDEPIDRELVARATRWTYAVFSELGLGRFTLDRYHPRFFRNEFWLDGGILLGGQQAASFGLFDEETGERGLGIILDVPSWPGPAFEIVDYATFPRLDGARFPVALRQSEIELHLAHPQGATASCWAQCNLTQQWGFLTAGHAVSGNRPGRAVPLAGGGSGSLIRSYYQPVDAAFVQGVPPVPVPPQLAVLSFPAVGIPVDIQCQTGGQSRTIVQVTNNMGVLHTRGIGIYVYLDRPVSPGDSGALVQTASGDAVAIYSGQLAVPGPPAGLCGVAQNFEQAIYALDVTPYL
jgi:hypothetical protein